MKNLSCFFLLFFVSFSYASDRSVTFDFQRIEISQALQLLSDYSDQNLVVSPDIQGEITMKLNNVPWSQAFDYVKTVADLQSFGDDGVILVTKRPISFNQAPDAPQQHPATLYKLDHVLPSRVADLFTLYPDEYLLASDDLSYIAANLPAKRLPLLASLITALDVKSSQVLIEAKIVEVNRDFIDSLGVNWSPSSVAVGNFDVSGSSVLSSVYSPAVSLGFVSSRAFLEAQLSAMESKGKGSIVSSPKIFVFDRHNARVSKGFEIPYQEIQSDGVVTTSFKDASLSLDVFPKVQGQNILVDVKLHKDEPDFSRVLSGQPPISTSSFSSSVRLISGQTVAIGGVVSSSTSNSMRRVPLLSKIPFLGRAFQFRSKSKIDSELFLFLTVTLAD